MTNELGTADAATKLKQSASEFKAALDKMQEVISEIEAVRKGKKP